MMEKQTISKKSSYRAKTGHDRIRIYKKNSGPRAEKRRLIALANLQKHLVNKKLFAKNNPEQRDTVVSSITRIKKEIGILETRLYGSKK